jgi:hypothetical protein
MPVFKQSLVPKQAKSARAPSLFRAWFEATKRRRFQYRQKKIARKFTDEFHDAIFGTLSALQHQFTAIQNSTFPIANSGGHACRARIDAAVRDGYPLSLEERRHRDRTRLDTPIAHQHGEDQEVGTVVELTDDRHRVRI